METSSSKKPYCFYYDNKILIRGISNAKSFSLFDQRGNKIKTWNLDKLTNEIKVGQSLKRGIYNIVFETLPTPLTTILCVN